jgi:sialic acid synthase SpsE
LFIISEIFPQHAGDLDLAETMILQSKMAGASAVKLQLYAGNEFSFDGLDRKYIELSRDGLARLMKFGRSISMPVFSTAFDDERLDWVLEEEQPYFKIPSRMHMENPDLVRRILQLNKPTFVSIPDGVDYEPYLRNENLILLKCVSNYPTLLEDWNLSFLSEGHFAGISDHSQGISVAIQAAATGAKYLEKHFTLSHALQKSTEKAHTGAFTFEELLSLKRTTLELSLIGKKPKLIK